MDKTCSILGIGYNWEEVNPNLLKQLNNEIKRLIANEGVTLFLIEQSYCGSSAVRIINDIKERNKLINLNLVVQ
jgi:ABC-type branched-subunit amino acid transport system ATPase component